MKRTVHLSSLILLLLGCAARGTGVDAPPAGGQSGDDGDAVPDPDPTPPIPPGIPQSPCDPEEAELGWEAATPFGGSALAALARLSPNHTLQMFWVPFDSLPGTSFTPGPGPAALALGLGARMDAAVKHVAWRPKSAQAVCPDETLRLPIELQLQTTDGALDVTVDGTLELSSGSTGHLSAELPPALGSFRFEQIGSPDQDWQVEGFNLGAELWPGGSRGEIYPSFTSVAPPSGPATPPPPPPPPTTSTPTAAGSVGPSIPAHWRSVAVWPLRENCDHEPRGPAGVYAVSDPAIGISINDVVNELNSRSEHVLLSGERALQVQFTLEGPVGLQCVRTAGRSMSFDVVATLRAGSGTGAPLEHLAASSTFELTATSTLDGSALERLHWVRRDVVYSQTRSAFEAATGLTLDAPDEYQQLWWSWHGTEARADGTAPWSTRRALVVSSLNAQQAAEIARVVAQGGPGAGISFDDVTQFPILPGDPLIQAGLSSAEPLRDATP